MCNNFVGVCQKSPNDMGDLSQKNTVRHFIYYFRILFIYQNNLEYNIKECMETSTIQAAVN